MGLNLTLATDLILTLTPPLTINHYYKDYKESWYQRHEVSEDHHVPYLTS